MTTTSAPFRFWFGFFAGAVAAVIPAAVVFHHHFLQPHYESGTTALIQIHSEPQTFIFEDEAKRLDAEEYRLKVDTQIALMRSPAVIEKALEKADVADLPIIKKQKDAPQFVLRHLKTEPIRHSEIIAVSMPRIPKHEAAVIVNALVLAYFDSRNLNRQDSTDSLIRILNAEMARQTAAAHLHQDAIRTKMKEVGNAGVSPQAIENIRQAAMKLAAMSGKKSALEKYMSETVKKGESTGEIEKNLDNIQTEIDNLTKTMNDSPEDSRVKTDADISFDQAALGRVNKMIDALSQRIIALQAEQYRFDSIQLLRLAKTDK